MLATEYMLIKFLNPKNDAAFKKIFGTVQNRDILIHFLNDMLIFKEGKPITDIVFLKTVLDAELLAKKTSVVDVLCTDEVGNQYIVEMQVADNDDFVKRAQYYAARAYSTQLNVGDKYKDLKEIIFLAITNFVMFPNKIHYKSDHVILDKYTYEHDLKDFFFTFLELPKFNKSKTELSNTIDKWAFFFKYAEETTAADLHEIIGEDIIIKKAYEELCKFNWTHEEMLLYEGAFKRHLDYINQLDFDLRQNQIKLEKYKEKIFTEGRAEGHAAGHAAGQVDKALHVAKKMLQKGMLIEEVTEIAGLSISQIKELI